MEGLDNFTSKRDFAQTLLRRTQIQLLVDARRPGVKLPANLLNDWNVRLNLSYRFSTPPELREDYVRVLLSFGGKDFECIIPWIAVWAIIAADSGDIHSFPNDLPREVKAEVATMAKDQAEKPVYTKPTLVWDNPNPERTPPRRGHLSLVK